MKKGKAAALCEVGQVHQGVTSWLCQQNDVIIAYEPSKKQRNLLTAL